MPSLRLGTDRSEIYDFPENAPQYSVSFGISLESVRTLWYVHRRPRRPVNSPAQNTGREIKRLNVRTAIYNPFYALENTGSGY